MSKSALARLRLVPSPARAGHKPAQPPAVDDSALLASLRRGDASIDVVFYERVRPIVDRTLSRLLGAGDPEYEDVAQIALYELVRSIDRFRGECPLDAWFSVVTARVVYNQIRRRRTERRLFEGSFNELDSNLHSMPVSLASRQAVERIRSHLHKMDVNRAWTFLLHDVYGYDLRETGSITGASLSAAQSRLVRGRRELHERIRKDPELAHLLDGLPEEVP